MREGGPVAVLREAKLTDLLADAFAGQQGKGSPDSRRLEGSGVSLAEGRLWVVFDNLAVVASIDPELAVPDRTARLVPVAPDLTDLEDITYDRSSGHFYLVVEGRRIGQGPPRALVAEYDAGWRPIARKWVDVPLVKANKGIEGLDVLRRGQRTYLLGLLEANRGLAGKAGRRPGGGRVHVLIEDDAQWRSVDTIELPNDLPFRDYSALSIEDDRVAVVSQESSAIWVGHLSPERWEIMDAGVVYPFPRDRAGHPVYRTIEGVTWLSGHELAAVSDRDSSGRSSGAHDKDQSVHLVVLPARR